MLAHRSMDSVVKADDPHLQKIFTREELIDPKLKRIDNPR